MNTAKTIASEKRSVWIIAKAVRVITIAPVMAAILFTVLFFKKDLSVSTWDYIAALAFICLLPVTAYPLQRFLPPFRDRGRDGQRALAFVMCNAGYVLGAVYAFAFTDSRAIFTLFFTYLMSGAVLLIVNKLVGFKASGHACGIAGPVAALAYFGGSAFLWVGGALFFGALWASLYMKRHTVLQFLIGALIPVLAFFTLVALVY